MDSERWWIVDEIARWWRSATQEARGVLMQRAIDGCKEATLAEVQKGAALAELDVTSKELRESLASEAKTRQFIEQRAAEERFCRR